jgi:PhnB protein
MIEQTTQGGVVPYLSLQGKSGAAMEFYERAFGATTVMRVPAESDPKRIIHCQVDINGGALMMTDFHPDSDHKLHPSLSYAMHLVVDDVDAWWKRAVDSGCEVATPMAPISFAMYARIKDPFGVRWAITGPASRK